jgi:O-antigen biosynthesis protein WbqP
MLLVALLVKLTSPGPVLYWSDRVGRDNKIFKMPKFRTMRIDTPPVATHLLENPEKYLTPIGPFLRKLSLDELPNPVKVEYDEYYLKNRSFLLDLNPNS